MLTDTQTKPQKCSKLATCDHSSQGFVSPDFSILAAETSPVAVSVDPLFVGSENANLGKNRDTPTNTPGKKKVRFFPNRSNIRLATAARLSNAYYIEHGKNLRGSSVSGCGRWLAFMSEPGLAAIKRERDDKGRVRSVMDGHFKCKCSWTCEPCGAKQCEHVRSWLIQEMYPALGRAGLTGGLMTLTIAHLYGDDWRTTVEAMRDAYSRFDKNAKRIYQEFGVVGKFRAAEAPVGRNGLHFHFHVLLPHFHLWPQDADGNEQHLVPRQGDWWHVNEDWPLDQNGAEQHLVPRRGDKWLSKADVARFTQKLDELWNESVRSVGRFCNEHGFDFQPDRLNTYLAKVGTAHEVASQSTKKGREKGKSLGQLLDAYSHGDSLAGAEWLRAIVALGGTSRFHAGQLPKKLGIESYATWEDPKKVDKPAPIDDTALIQYSIDDHLKATSPITQRPALAMILRAARQVGYVSAVKRMVSALCSEYDKLKIPPWVMNPSTYAPPDPEIPIMQVAKMRPLTKDEVAEYLRVKRGFGPTMALDDLLDVGVPMAADADCPF